MRFQRMHLLWIAFAILLLPTTIAASPPVASASGTSSATPRQREMISGRPVARMGECDPADPEAPKPIWTKEMRQETRARVQRACRDLGAAPIICAYMDLIVVRESHGRAGVRHLLGHNENGLGAMGLSKRWQSHRWPGKDEEPMFCQPEASAVVTQGLLFRAYDHYRARDVGGLQSIFAGKWFCFRENGFRHCSPSQRYYSNGSLCSAMKARGFSCRAKITRSDLGRPLKLDERRAFVEEQIAKGAPPVR